MSVVHYNPHSILTQDEIKKAMHVRKRDGRLAPVRFDKISHRIEKLGYGLNPDYVDTAIVSQKVCMGVYKGVSTQELDELAAETSAHLTSIHPDYGTLASRIAVSNLHKSTIKSFSQTASVLYNYIEPRTGLHAPMLSDHVYQFIQRNASVLDGAINYDRDYLFDYFGFKTLCHGYLLKVTGQIAERPQHMIMRIAIGVHLPDPPILEAMLKKRIHDAKEEIENSHNQRYFAALHSEEKDGNDQALAIEMELQLKLAEVEQIIRSEFKEEEPKRNNRILQELLEYYEHISLKEFTPATPTLFNAGTRHPQLSSCVLMTLDEDSIEGIFKSIGDCAAVSKKAAGIGFALHKMRAAGSYIKGTNGTSAGIVPFIRIFNATAKAVDQGGGKRKGKEKNTFNFNCHSNNTTKSLN
jgi:ribonucleotide reductase alpha subunit